MLTDIPKYKSTLIEENRRESLYSPIINIKIINLNLISQDMKLDYIQVPSHIVLTIARIDYMWSREKQLCA